MAALRRQGTAAARGGRAPPAGGGGPPTPASSRAAGGTTGGCSDGGRSGRTAPRGARPAAARSADTTLCRRVGTWFWVLRGRAGLVATPAGRRGSFTERIYTIPATHRQGKLFSTVNVCSRPEVPVAAGAGQRGRNLNLFPAGAQVSGRR